VCVATFLVLSIELFIFVEGPALACPLGLVDCVAADFVVGFATGIFHCVG